ncbi:hypothetical protein BN2537_67 [Streptomyces venezuelae]|nr:hypothetical protein BN2537_67 [Streptomyces venezuelae]
MRRSGGRRGPLRPKRMADGGWTVLVLVGGGLLCSCSGCDAQTLKW